MRAERTMRITASTESLRDVIAREFDTTDAGSVDDHCDVQVAAMGGIDRDAYLCIAITAVGPEESEVQLTMQSHLRVPYFNWAIGAMTLGQLERRVDHCVARLEAALSNGPAPEPMKAPLLLANVPFSPAQGALLATAAMATSVATFGGSLFGQNAQNIQDNFGISDQGLTTALAVSRAGALVALFVMGLADRVGRRRMILTGLIGIAVANTLTALAPDIYTLTVLQAIARGFVGAAALVAGIAAIEEAPEGARAFAAAMLAMAGGFGFTLVVILLPIADRGEQAWRVSYLVSGLSVLLVPSIARNLKESRRYERVASSDVERGRAGEVVDRRYGKRFAVLAAVGFMTNMLSAPSAQLMNKYLEDDRGFSNSGITGFRAATTGFPGFIGIVLAGRLSEARGRRPVAAMFLALAGLCQIGFFLSEGVMLYVFSMLSVLAASCGGLAISTMGAELFPTEVRGTSNGMLLVVSVTGSAAGLILAGQLSDPLGGIGKAIALCAIPTIIAALIFVPRLPESAGQDLDDISPTEEEPDVV
jgi:MFS family permease